MGPRAHESGVWEETSLANQIDTSMEVPHGRLFPVTGHLCSIDREVFEYEISAMVALSHSSCKI